MRTLLKAIAGERAFKAATAGALALLSLFFLGIILSILSYTNWDAFIEALLSPEILFAVRLSFVTATIATALSLLVAVPVAYTISQHSFKGKDLVDSLLDLPIVVSPVALGAALLVFFNTPLGSAIEGRPLSFVFAVPGIVLAQFTIISALAVRLLKSTFDNIDTRYEQVGRTLGYSKAEVFFKVTIPLARNGLIASAILTWARAIGEFGATVTLAGATPLKTETLPAAIALSLSTANIEKAIAVVLILIIIAIAALMTIRKAVGRRTPI
ncbi:MAG: ABC transporter permease subunit [Chloroflexi bacterium]|nr:ABC transporter permease subunit [Chloroflexota bacterium]